MRPIHLLAPLNSRPAENQHGGQREGRGVRSPRVAVGNPDWGGAVTRSRAHSHSDLNADTLLLTVPLPHAFNTRIEQKKKGFALCPRWYSFSGSAAF